MTCQTADEFQKDRFLENLVPSDGGDGVSLGMGVFNAGLNVAASKLGLPGGFNFYNDIKTAVVGGAANAGDYGGLNSLWRSGSEQ